jgi:hypothetical protein
MRASNTNKSLAIKNDTLYTRLPAAVSSAGVLWCGQVRVLRRTCLNLK